MKYEVKEMICESCNVMMEPWWKEVEIKDTFVVEIQGRICRKCGSVFVAPIHPAGEVYGKAMVEFAEDFLRLDLPGFGNLRNIDSQIAALSQVSFMMHGLSRTPGGTIGYSPFHIANRIANATDYAIGTLREVNALFHLMKQLTDQRGLDLGCYEDSESRKAKEGVGT